MEDLLENTRLAETTHCSLINSSIITEHASKLDHMFKCLGLSQCVCINGEIMRQRKRASYKMCLWSELCLISVCIRKLQQTIDVIFKPFILLICLSFSALFHPNFPPLRPSFLIKHTHQQRECINHHVGQRRLWCCVRAAGVTSNQTLITSFTSTFMTSIYSSQMRPQKQRSSQISLRESRPH